MVPLSQEQARRNCSGGEDAVYPQLDEKTPEPLLYSGIDLWSVMCSIVGSL